MRGDIAEGGGEAVSDEPEEERCAYVVDAMNGDREARFCDTICLPGSAYCPAHHARCHLPCGSAAERHQLRKIEALAAAAGGKQVRTACEPSTRMLRRLERAARGALARLKCSCIVLKGAGDAADL
jgi:hypothetical protein